ncbi:MAG: hypothetical protein ACR2PF_04625 [Rhizobiaceae bacterium]
MPDNAPFHLLNVADSNSSTSSSIRDLVASVRPSIEQIDNRNAHYTKVDAHTLIAGRAWFSGVMLGAPSTG